MSFCAGYDFDVELGFGPAQTAGYLLISAGMTALPTKADFLFFVVIVNVYVVMLSLFIS